VSEPKRLFPDPDTNLKGIPDPDPTSQVFPDPIPDSGRNLTFKPNKRKFVLISGRSVKQWD